MPFNTNNNTGSKYSQNHNSVSTNGLMMFSDDMALRISFLDDAISFTFTPAVMNDDGSRRFPKEGRIYAVLKTEAATAFLRKIDNFFIPKTTEMFEESLQNPSATHTPIEMGVPTNSQYTNIVSLYYDDPTNGSYMPEIRLHQNIDVQTRMPEKTVRFVFGTRPVFNKYDSKTGEYDLSNEQVQFYLFYESLRAYVTASTNAFCHSDRTVNSYVNKEQRNLVRQIAQKNGISTDYNGGGAAAAFMDNSGKSTTSTEPQQESIDSLFTVTSGDDLPF